MSTDSEFSSLQTAIDENEADTSILHENKVKDLVIIANGNIIANEQQMVLGHLGLTTGFMWPHKRNVNSILTGPSAGGKSDTQQAIVDGLPMDLGYKASDSSAMGVLDDDRWEQSLYAPLDEWQKIPEKLTEIMKGVAGGPDDEYRYVRSVSDDEADSGRSGHEIVKKAKPYQFLYAQHALDHELSTRLLFLPIDDNVHIRDAIIEKQGGAESISVEGYDKEFIFDTVDRERAMRQHLREIPTEMDDDGNNRGLVDGKLPPWIRKSVKPIFDKSRTETNRVSGQIFNLIRSSAVINHDDRESITVTHDDKEVTAYIATPQDAANVMSCRETLLAKTHHLTTIKREMLNAIRAHQHFDQAEEGVGVTVTTIRNYLEDSSSLSVPRKDKLRDLLRELSEHFYVEIHERAGPNGAHLYEFKSLRDIGVPRVSNLKQYMDDGEIEKCESLCPDVDLSDPYVDSNDPFRDQPFKETVESMRDEFAANAVERATQSAELVAGGGSSDDNPKGQGGETTDEGELTLQQAMGGDSDGETDVETQFDDQSEVIVYQQLTEHADDVVWEIDNVEDLHLVGAVEKGESVSEADFSGTIVNPDHECWDTPVKPDDWVTDESDAEKEIEEAMNALETKGIIEFEMDGQPDGYVVTHVEGVDG